MKKVCVLIVPCISSTSVKNVLFLENRNQILVSNEAKVTGNMSNKLIKYDNY